MIRHILLALAVAVAVASAVILVTDLARSEEKTYTFTQSQMDKIGETLKDTPKRWADPVWNEIAQFAAENEKARAQGEAARLPQATPEPKR